MTLRLADISEQLATVTLPEREIVRLLTHRTNPVLFDIGACEGEDSIRYARRFPRGKVYAFEPLPDNQALVQANCQRFHATNVELVPLALSDHRGPATFHVSAGEPGKKFSGENWNYGNKSSSLLPPASDEPMHGWIRFPRQISVNCETLDEFCAQRGITRVDFIHMDVQGAEWLALQGARRMLPTATALWMEVADTEMYHGQKLRPEVDAFMALAGFRVAHRDLRGAEGDQLYLNRGLWRGRRRLAELAAQRALQRVRRTLGAWRARFRSAS